MNLPIQVCTLTDNWVRSKIEFFLLQIKKNSNKQNDNYMKATHNNDNDDEGNNKIIENHTLTLRNVNITKQQINA